jgi:hypothetical protein
MLRHPHMPHPVFGNTIFAGTESKNGNKCCQVFATNFGWARAYPLKQKGEAHEALLLMFKPDGIPPKMFLDSSKERVEGVFRRKLKEVNYHMRVTEPYSLWPEAAKGCICKLKHLHLSRPKKDWQNKLFL